MFNYTWRHLGLMPCESTIWNRRCRAIEKELKRHCIKSSVSRHTLFDTDYYLIEVSDNKHHISGDDIAEALDISKDWVCLYHCRAGERTYYAVLEDELNDKYKNCNGELVFDEPFDLMDAIRISGMGCIEKRLKECDRCPDVIVNKHKNILTIQNYGWSSQCVANALNISKDAVVDVSCDDSDTQMIVLLDEVG